MFVVLFVFICCKVVVKPAAATANQNMARDERQRRRASLRNGSGAGGNGRGVAREFGNSDKAPEITVEGGSSHDGALVCIGAEGGLGPGSSGPGPKSAESYVDEQVAAMLLRRKPAVFQSTEERKVAAASQAQGNARRHASKGAKEATAMAAVKAKSEKQKWLSAPEKSLMAKRKSQKRDHAGALQNREGKGVLTFWKRSGKSSFVRSPKSKSSFVRSPKSKSSFVWSPKSNSPLRGECKRRGGPPSVETPKGGPPLPPPKKPKKQDTRQEKETRAALSELFSHEGPKAEIYNEGDRVLLKNSYGQATYEGRLLSSDEQHGSWKVCFDYDGLEVEEEIDVRDLAPLRKNWQDENGGGGGENDGGNDKQEKRVRFKTEQGGETRYLPNSSSYTMLPVSSPPPVEGSGFDAAEMERAMRNSMADMGNSGNGELGGESEEEEEEGEEEDEEEEGGSSLQLCRSKRPKYRSGT